MHELSLLGQFPCETFPGSGRVGALDRVLGSPSDPLRRPRGAVLKETSVADCALGEVRLRPSLESVVACHSHGQ